MIYRVEVHRVAGIAYIDVEMDSPNTGGQIEAAGQKAIAALLADPEKTNAIFNSLMRQTGEVEYNLVVRDVCPRIGDTCG